MRFKSILENFIFNESWTCNVCGREVFKGDFCEECEKSLPFIGDTKCEHCGRKTVQSVKYCPSCSYDKFGFDKAVSVFEYRAPVDKLIKSLKYGGNKYISHLLARYMSEKFIYNFSDAEVITFVPCTVKRLKERGFNQAELLAKELSGLCGAEVKSLIEKVEETDEQVGLTAEKRRKNLVKAFKVKDKKEVEGKRIVIVDDVMTTGSTVTAVSEKLLKAGASAIYVMTVASVSKEG